MPVRFLIAEDQRAHQKLLANVVLFLGAESSFASNGLEAIEMAQREHFDVVLMDLEMPHIGGLTASDRLLEEWKDVENRTRIVVVSGHSAPESVNLCRMIGMDGFIAKPYSTTALRRSLQEVITRGYCWQDGPTRRLLNLEVLSQTLAKGEADFDQQSKDIRSSLKLLASGPAVFEDPLGLETLTSVRDFAEKHGMVKLQAAMERIATLPGESDAEEIMSEQCADELRDYDLVVEAVHAIEVEAPVIF